ncbi:hypothetical protein FRC10_002954, partial [Ceratobasidium sp. 414]
VTPNMLYDVHIRRIGSTMENLKKLCLQPGLNQMCFVLQVIVLLKAGDLRTEMMVSKGPKK